MSQALSYFTMIAMSFICITGCQSASPERQVRMSRGYVYYCDGAGGGGLMNWSGGLRQGLVEGGYPGAGEIFVWNTGLGVVADQKAGVEYKRRKAREMAREVAVYTSKYPGAPVNLIGLSAGTTIVVFGLEEMPHDIRVENAVLCGASISSTYDLTPALQNLNGKLYVFTSEKDSVLGFLVPMAGTADRASGEVPSAGLRGFSMPRPPSAETHKQYTKVVTIPWRPEFASLGYAGGHTDVLGSRFVAAHIAPRLVKRAGATPPELASTEGEVRNPDYDRWAGFGVGSFLISEGYQEYQGVRTPVQVKTILRSKSEDRLELVRQFYLTDQSATLPTQIHSLIAETWIDPKHHPITDPVSKLEDLSTKRISVKGRIFTCSGRSIDANGNYPDWGSDLTAIAYRCPELPGGVVELKLKSHFKGEPFIFEGRVVDYRIVPE